VRTRGSSEDLATENRTEIALYHSSILYYTIIFSQPMETFYISHEQFWNWFDEQDRIETFEPRAQLANIRTKVQEPSKKRVKVAPPSDIDRKYVIMYGRHRPGKKNKVWEGDGYLYMSGQMAFVSNLQGRRLEEPTLLDEEDYNEVKNLGEILIGDTEVQIVEVCDSTE